MLLEVEQEGAYANLVLQKMVPESGLRGADVGLLTELVYGALRWRNRLDYVIDRFSKVPAARMNHIVRNILRLGAYQLLFLDRVPAAAACNESVVLAKQWQLGGLAGFVNGLLRNIARSRHEIAYPSLEEEPVLHISTKYSHPAWLVERWIRRFGVEETISLCRCNNQPPPVVLRCNTLKIEPDGLRDQLGREGIVVSPSPLLQEALRVVQFASWPSGGSEQEERRASPGRPAAISGERSDQGGHGGALQCSPQSNNRSEEQGRRAASGLGSSVTGSIAFRNGYFAVQDESSMLASILLQPRAGSLVIDACSGPGGKTTHLAQIMKNRGRLVALDIHPHRLKLIRDACNRLGITIVETLLIDAAAPPAELLGQADYLLVDAPCSGSGVIRRRPDLRWRIREQDLPVLASQQLKILEGACECVKPGGSMLYSTCSTEPEENDEVVDKFLDGHRQWQPLDIGSQAPQAFLISAEDRERALRGCLQLWPHHHGTDGFYVAAFKNTRQSGG